MELLNHKYGNKPTQLNQVYQDFISDRDNTHLNATKWTTITSFALVIF